jgi:hypothetical protein
MGERRASLFAFWGSFAEGNETYSFIVSGETVTFIKIITE